MDSTATEGTPERQVSTCGMRVRACSSTSPAATSSPSSVWAVACFAWSGTAWNASTRSRCTREPAYDWGWVECRRSSSRKTRPFSDRSRLAVRPRRRPTDAPDGEENHHNLLLSAGLVIPLSSFSEGSAAGGLRGGAIPLEPFAGRLNFADEVGLGDQNVAGVRTGIDFNSLFGARGFYWKGINEDVDGTDPVQAYGGEAQFNLNTGPGLSPYVVLGAGRLDFDGEFRDSLGLTPADRNLLILGGGLGFALSERVRLNVSARDYLFTREELGETRDTNDLLHNLMLSAGLTFSIGGRTAARSGDDPALEALEAETERLRLENQRLRGVSRVAQVDA